MALTTQCPHCSTIFRVASDQLKLRAGLVRCGACEDVFNALDNLLPENSDTAQVDDDPASDVPAADVPAADAPASDTPASDTPASEGEQLQAAQASEQFPDLLLDLNASTNSPDAPNIAAMSFDEEPGFVTRARQVKRFSRVLRLALIGGSVVLGTGALLQAMFTFRDPITLAIPQTKPMLMELCALLDCRIGLAAQINTLNVESVEMQPSESAKDRYELTVLVRNRSSKAQTWPHLELSLNDSEDKIISRKIIKPENYLSAPGELNLGLAANSEQRIKLRFEIPLFQPDGYRVMLFYP